MREMKLGFIGIAFFAVTAAMAPAASADYNHLASKVAGKQIFNYCATTPEEWDGLVTTAFQGRLRGNEVSGYASPGQYTYLSDQVCNILNTGTSDRLGVALAILAHEAAHARGILDEGQAQCWGLVWWYSLAHDYYGVAYHSQQMLDLERKVLAWQATQTDRYSLACAALA